MSPQAGKLLVREIAPRIEAVIPRSVKLVGSEDVEEVTQDAIALAANILERVERSWKQSIGASNIAYYALQHIKSGRRSVGYSGVDVLASATQFHGKWQVESLEMLFPADDEDSDGIPLGEMMSRDNEDPAIIGARAVDWERFLKTQDDCSKTVIVFTAEGRKLMDAVRDRGFSPQKVHETKNRLRQDLREFFGENILSEIVSEPSWKAGLMATREKHAARAER